MQTLRFLAPLALVGAVSAQQAYLVDTTLDQLFTVDLATGAATFLSSVANNGLSTAADLSYRAATGELWTVDLSGGELGTIDPASGTFTAVYQTNLSGWQGLAWDETTQLFYLANQDNNNYSFDPITGVLTTLGPAGASLITCLDTDANGNLFGIAFSAATVVAIDKVTGAATALSTTIGGFQGLGIDQVTGTWYGSNTNDDSLHLVDPGTGTNTLIGGHGAGVTFAKGFDLIDGSAGTPAANTTFGTACGGLSLAGITRPITGTNWDLGLTGVPATATIGVMLLGFGNPNQSLAAFGAPGCTQYSDAAAFVLLPLPVSTPAFSFAIPANPGLINVNIFTQGGALVPGANPLGIAASNGLNGAIGDV